MPATATATAHLDRLRPRFSDFTFLLQASRPGLWLTAIWFYLLPLGGRHVFHSVAFWLGVVYVSFPLGLLLYGWDDCVDFEVDRLNPRKGSFLFGARACLGRCRKPPAGTALARARCVPGFCDMGVLRILLWFAGTVAAAAIYNWPRSGFKSRPPLEILNQAGYLLVFVLSSWLNHMAQ